MTADHAVQGRMRAAHLTSLLVAAGFVVSGLLAAFPRRAPKPSWKKGRVNHVDLTLVTSDRSDLACLADSTLGPYRCGFNDEATRWRGDERETLQPFRTVDGQLLLVAGLFAAPALDARHRADPPDIPRERRARFTARCRLRVEGSLSGFRVRWTADDVFGDPEEKTPVTSVVECRVID